MTSPHSDAAATLEDAARLVALLAEPARLRVAAAIVLGHARVTDIAGVTGVPAKEVSRAIARLAAGGLVVKGEEGYRFATDELKAAARLVADAQPEVDIDAPPDEARVLRAFLREGRLTAIPTMRSKRLIVLDHLVQAFEPGRRYPERAVNEVLAGLHDDTASLRRYLVDEGFMTREGGYYWRSGGRFEVD